MVKNRMPKPPIHWVSERQKSRPWDVAADGEGQGSEDTENNPCERYHEVGIAAA